MRGVGGAAHAGQVIGFLVRFWRLSLPKKWLLFRASVWCANTAIIAIIGYGIAEIPLPDWYVWPMMLIFVGWADALEMRER